MKRFSESLEELSTRVAALEDSATAAYVADRAKLELRREEIKAAFDTRVDDFDSAVHEAAAAGQSWWNDAKSSIVRPFAQLRERHDERQAEHEVQRAVDAADAAEEDAVAAIDLAAYFLNVAEYAVVDAALARLVADDLVESASTVGATS